MARFHVSAQVGMFILLGVFWVAWIYTEVNEYFSRSRFNQNVHEFMNAGDRFTIDDGKALEDRLRNIEVEYFNHLEHSATFTEKIKHNERDIIGLHNRVIRLEDETFKQGKSFQ